MRVAIDARLNAYRRGGIPEYTRQLLTAMAAQDRRTNFVSLQHRDQQRPLVIAANVRRHTILTPPHHQFEQWTLPAELLLVRPDVLHCPDFVVPLRRTFPAVATIHDLAFLHYPEILDDDARRYYNQVRASVHSADAVIAVSEATRDDIVNLLDLPADRIDVVYEAASPFFTPIDLEEEAVRTIGPATLQANSFLLFVSTLEPRKNLPMLLQALRICIDRRPDAGYQLAVAGARGWRYKPIFEAVRDLRLDDAVTFLDNVSGNELRWLYNACRVYVNPSLYEGFGLPALEALACGAPTLVSNTSSLPELVGDAAMLLHPTAPEEWADAIEQLWFDDEQRAELAARGPEQARQFTWQRAARQTLAIYERVASDSEPEEDPVTSVAPVPVAAVAQSGDEPDEVAVEQPAPEDAVTVAAAMIYEPVEQSLPVTAEDIPQTAERPCLRCGTPLEAGELSSDMHWHTNGTLDKKQPVRAWSCHVCGYIELALDRPNEP